MTDFLQISLPQKTLNLRNPTAFSALRVVYNYEFSELLRTLGRFSLNKRFGHCNSDQKNRIWPFATFSLRNFEMVTDVEDFEILKGNAQFLFLCNPQKSSVNVCFMKIIKKHCHKKR